MMTRLCSLAFLLVLLSLLVLPAWGQLVQRHGFGVANDEANDIAALPDGRMVITGKTSDTFGGPDRWFVQWLDANGDRLNSNRRVGQDGHNDDPAEGEGIAIAALGTDEAIVAGWMRNEDGNIQYVVAKATASSTDFVWEDGFLSEDPEADFRLVDVAVAPNGNVYAAGDEYGDAWVVRLDPEDLGNVVWTGYMSEHIEPMSPSTKIVHVYT